MTSVQQLRRLTRSEGLQSSVLMIGGNVFAQGLSGVAIILLSRFLGPVEFGIFSTGFALALITASLIDLGLTASQQQAVPRATTDHSRNQLFNTAIWLKSLIFLAIVLIALPLSPLLSERLNFSSPLLVLWITLANIGSVYFNQLAAMLLSLKRIHQTIISNSSQAIIKVILTLLVFFTAFTSGEVVLLVYLLVPLAIAPFARLLLPAWYRWQVKFDLTSWMTMRSMALNNWVASIGSVLIANIDIIFVSVMLTQNEAGLMGAASRLAMFIALIGSSLAGVLNPRVSTYQSVHDLNSYWRKAMLLLIGSIGLALLSFVLAAPLISLTVGGNYQSASSVLGWLLAASWLGVGLAPLSALFYSYNKAWYFSVSVAVQAGVLVLGNVLLLPTYGIIAAGWIRLAAQLAIVIFTICLALYTHQRKFQELPQLW